MVKFFISFTFLIIFIVSIYILIQNQLIIEDDESLLQTPEQRLRVNMTNIKFVSYGGDKINSSVEAKRAFFQQKQNLRLRDGVEGYVNRGKNTYKFKTKEADILFDQDLNQTAFSGMTLNKINVLNNVELILLDGILKTSKATYSAKENIISSNAPVEMVGVGKRFYGTEGFVLNLIDESFVIFGSTEGYFENGEIR